MCAKGVHSYTLCDRVYQFSEEDEGLHVCHACKYPDQALQTPTSNTVRQTWTEQSAEAFVEEYQHPNTQRAPIRAKGQGSEVAAVAAAHKYKFNASSSRMDCASDQPLKWRKVRQSCTAPACADMFPDHVHARRARCWRAGCVEVEGRGSKTKP